MITAASGENLKAALTAHRKVTENHVERLARVLEIIGKKPQARKCKGMAGLLEESAEVIAEEMHPDMKDAALIGAARRVEHYEMAASSTVEMFATSLGDPKSSTLLKKTLDEEQQADKLLTESFTTTHVLPSRGFRLARIRLLNEQSRSRSGLNRGLRLRGRKAVS